MAIRINYANGSSKTIAEAVKVDSQNFHEGMYDFYDARGNLLRQISMDENFKWELVDEPESGSEPVK